MYPTAIRSPSIHGDAIAGSQAHDAPRADTTPNSSLSPSTDDIDSEAPLNLADEQVLSNMSAHFGFGRNGRAQGKFKKHVPSSSDDSDEELEFEAANGKEGSSDEESEDEEDGAGTTPRPVIPDPTCPSSPSLKIIDRRGGSDDYGRVKLAGGAWVSNYEYSRLFKIAENRQLLASLNIPAAVQAVVGPPQAPQRSTARAHPIASSPTAPSRVLPTRASKSQNIS